MGWETDAVYKYLSEQSQDNKIYEIHEINLTNSEQIELSLFLIYIILLFILLIILISGILHSLFNSICQCCKREDNFRLNYIFIFIIYSWEYIADILFCCIMFVNHYKNGYSINDDLNNKYTILILISIGCLSFTYLINLIIGLRMIYILYKYNCNINYWFKSSCFNSSLFLFITFITFGITITVPLFNSNLFGLSIFDMQISKYDINYIFGKRAFNICTQLLPLLLIRIIYLLLIETFDIIILSSFIPIFLSLSITVWFLCHSPSSRYYDDRYLSRNKLKCSFEVSGPDLSSLRHLGLTKHLQNKLIQLFKIDNNEIELFKPIDRFDKITPRFEIRFIIRSNQEQLERIQHSFYEASQNGQLSKAISQIFDVNLVHISKQSEEIVKNPHLLWGLQTSVHHYNDIDHHHNNNNNHNQYPQRPRYDIINNNDNIPTKTANIYYDGELRNNVNIEANAPSISIKRKNEYQSLKSRSSTSFNHPPIYDAYKDYKHDMAEIDEENIIIANGNDNYNDNDNDNDHDINKNMADASSLTDRNNIQHQQNLIISPPQHY